MLQENRKLDTGKQWINFLMTTLFLIVRFCLLCFASTKLWDARILNFCLNDSSHFYIVHIMSFVYEYSKIENQKLTKCLRLRLIAVWRNHTQQENERITSYLNNWLNRYYSVFKGLVFSNMFSQTPAYCVFKYHSLQLVTF